MLASSDSIVAHVSDTPGVDMTALACCHRYTESFTDMVGGGDTLGGRHRHTGDSPPPLLRSTSGLTCSHDTVLPRRMYPVALKLSAISLGAELAATTNRTLIVRPFFLCHEPLKRLRVLIVSET